MLEQGQTPLLIRGENLDFDPLLADNEKVAIGENAAGILATPTTLPDRGVIGQTPVPHRDQLRLNRRPHSEFRGVGDDSASVGSSTFATTVASIKELAREERRAAKRARKELEEALIALPEPQFEYELTAPQLVTDDDLPTTRAFQVPTDAADVAAAEKERLKREANKLYEDRSAVVKRRELPRPIGTGFNGNVVQSVATLPERLVVQEMLTLIQHDSHAFPYMPPPALADGGGGGKKKGGKKRKTNDAVSTLVGIPDVPLGVIEERFLDVAKKIVKNELEQILAEKMDMAIEQEVVRTEHEAMEVLAHQNGILSETGCAEQVYVASGWKSRSNQTMVDSLRLEFETLKESASVLRKRNEKLESKIVVKIGGYSRRADTTKATIQQAVADLEHSRIEQLVFLKLQRQENQGGESRCQRLLEEISELQDEEARAQKHYGDFLLEKKRLLLKRKADIASD
jgi:hypothetical protein